MFFDIKCEILSSILFFPLLWSYQVWINANSLLACVSKEFSLMDFNTNNIVGFSIPSLFLLLFVVCFVFLFVSLFDKFAPYLHDHVVWLRNGMLQRNCDVGWLFLFVGLICLHFRCFPKMERSNEIYEGGSWKIRNFKEHRRGW